LTDLVNDRFRQGAIWSPKAKWSLAKYCQRVHLNIFSLEKGKGRKPMTKQASTISIDGAGTGVFSSTTAIAALLFLAAKFPHRQFNSAELCVLSGVGRTAMSQIKNAADTPFSLGKCTLQRLDAWLARHPGFKQE
jgi:hypothetical protein